MKYKKNKKIEVYKEPIKTIEEIPVIKEEIIETEIIKQPKSTILTSVRQFMYENKQFNENLIKTLERTYSENKKSEEQWIDIMIAKKIIFK